MTFHTTDISDAHGEQVQVLAPIFQHFGGIRRFAGPVATLKVFEDNSLVRAALETPGEGRVLVIDGGGSLRCALVGGQLGELAVKNKWAGIVVWGCVRDSAELAAQALGIMGLAAHPRKSVKRGEGVGDITISLGGSLIKPGDWLYADEDGVVIAEQRLS